MQSRAARQLGSIAHRQAVRGRLADRREAQAREVFDLGAVLLPRVGNRLDLLRPVRSSLRTAVERALTMSYADYKAQVVSYLHPDHAATYGLEETWDAMQLRVAKVLERASGAGGGS